MLIVENTIIERLNDENETVALLRVLWVWEEENYIVVINIDNSREIDLPFFLNYEDLIEEISEQKSRISAMETDLRLISPEDSYLEKYKNNRDNRWEIIKDIVSQEPDIYISDSRGRLITEAHLKSGKAKKVIRDYLKKYWFYGKTRNGLLDNYFDCGAPGRERTYQNKPGARSQDGNTFLVTEMDKEIFLSAIRLFHIRRNMDIKTTYEHMCETFYKRGFYRKFGVRVPIVNPEKSPTLRQFRYWYQKDTSFSKRYANRHGKRRASIDVRPLQGNASERATSIGALFEIDSTPADISLVSFDRKTILGRPTLYIVIDVFSLLVVGYHVSLASPSWIEAMVALENAVTNKVENCARYNMQIEAEDWPCHYLPRKLVCDRGELKGKNAEKFVNLEVDVLNAPSYRGDLKPFVERRFRITNETIRQLLPAGIGSKPLVRGDRDPAKDAALTIEEFNQFLIVFFLTYNKSALNREYLPTKEMFEEGVELTPLKVWNWGSGKKLLHEKSRNLIRYNLMPREQAKVSRFGIEFKGLCYTCEIGLKEGWFEEKGGKGSKYIEVTYDPRNCSSIYYKHKDGNLIQCILTSKYQEYKDLHFDEISMIMKYRKEQIKLQERNEKQHNSELHAFSQALTRSATTETKKETAEMSFYAKQKDKREHRKVDKGRWGAEYAWTNTSEGSQKNHDADLGRLIHINQDAKLEETRTSDFYDDAQTLFSRRISERRVKRDLDE
ncbi:transposase [Paenibacillus sp. PK3_47]|uniref:Mu transposase C-terminal domain-containing protein n=1 Tax=Paenibacillus sp. PK3_47 TaxID=2072642 RepID=UPI00201DA5E7|nr:Mu transposase C-terminal domain-containing protein [Paenibacillus sp. PK3_47]UQZ33640.1 transposase [Paenibacillus sp. PK3_47]